MRTVMLMLGVVAATAACGGGRATASPVDTSAGPAEAVTQFMQAVADSSLTRMAELWGTSRGSAAETGQPRNYQRRVAVMWAYLRGARATVGQTVEVGSGKAVLSVDLERDGCTRRVPFEMVRTGRGNWLVQAIELDLIGVPGRPCAADQRQIPPR